MASKISDEYLEQLKGLHKKAFGSGKAINSLVANVLDQNSVSSLLDFGCGKGLTTQKIKETYPNINVYAYDPVTSPIELPESVDMIHSSDVLEHIEYEYLDETLDKLFSIASKYQYHLIACHPSKKKLPDGRNAHLIVETPDWWKDKLTKYGWNFEHENIIEKYNDKFNINIVKYIVVLKK